jgi:hypothetical protein
MTPTEGRRANGLHGAAALLLKTVLFVAVAATALVLLATLYLIYRESTWLPPPPDLSGVSEDVRNERSFFHGTIGTEVAPLPVLKVLPEICKEHFQRQGAKGSWADQFGFLPSSLAPERAPPDPAAKDLPLGFTVSHYRPKSGAPSPVLFVGLGCATCHTTRINGKLVPGTGNSSLNLFAWIDAFQASLRDDRLTYSAVLETYQKDPANPPLSLEEKGMIALWLSGARAKQEEDVTRYDEPYGNGQSFEAACVPTGPCRTQPFRTLVRTLLHRPGADMKVYTKIAAMYQEQPDEWGQFDGGIHGLHRRSAGAALAAGATPQNMTLPEIANNINWASDYIVTLRGPTWAKTFPDKPIDETKSKAGKEVYLAHCDRCHGHPEGDQWKPGSLDGQMTPLAEVRTDKERVSFRGFEEVPDKLAVYFPKDHPFDFPRDTLRPAPRKNPQDPVERAFINKRMHSAFSRAPYLHNGSVLTLRELINLEPRRDTFYRGANDYDTNRVGLASPGKPDADHYFLFDTAVPGNSNKGHDYPWTREEVGKDAKKAADLENLLEYLKTL